LWFLQSRVQYFRVYFHLNPKSEKSEWLEYMRGVSRGGLFMAVACRRGGLFMAVACRRGGLFMAVACQRGGVSEIPLQP
jgi:hypothetical protein